jgi:hypothetical protein
VARDLHELNSEEEVNSMPATTLKKAVLILAFASAVPLAACSDDPETPSSPTQPGPTVTEPPTTTTPPPDPTPPTTPTPPTDDRPVVSITGPVVNLTRGGANNLDITFRIDDFTIVRAAGGTPVTFGSQTFDTDAVRHGQTVTVQGKRDNGFLDATRIDIVTQAPQ